MSILAFYAPYPGAGKTLAARWLARRLFLRRISFSTPLRFAVLNIISYPHLSPWAHISAPKEKEEKIKGLDVSWRELMVAVGNACRSLKPDFWARLMARHMDMYPWDYVVDDLRFQNEYDFLRARGAKIIRIENPGREIVTTSTEGRLEGNRFDAVIANTKESLRGYLCDVQEVATSLLE